MATDILMVAMAILVVVLISVTVSLLINPTDSREMFCKQHNMVVYTDITPLFERNINYCVVIVNDKIIEKHKIVKLSEMGGWAFDDKD